MVATTMQQQEEARLDEPALRRPDFRGGRPIELADEQEWTVPIPEMSFRPSFTPDRKIVPELVSSFGPEFDRKVEDFQAALSEADQVSVLFDIGIDLLDRNYDLTIDHYRRLLRFRPGDIEANRHLIRLFRVALGLPDEDPAAGPAAS